MGSEQSSESTLWRLDNGRAMRLTPEVSTRRLRVREGRLWLTTFGNDLEQAADIWLEAGQEMNLPDGRPWVAEAWPAASFEILVTPVSTPAPSKAPAARSTGFVAWHRWLRVLQRRRSFA